MKKIIRLTETDLTNLVKRVLKEHPISKPNQVTTTTTTKKVDRSLQAQQWVVNNFKKNATITLYDRPNSNGEGIGSFVILGQVPARDENKLVINKPANYLEELGEIDANAIGSFGLLTFRVVGQEGNNKAYNADKELNLTFKCKNKHALIAGKIRRNQLGKFFVRTGDAFNWNQATVYAPNLTNNLLAGYCRTSGKNVVTKTDI
jgi:hypothetical protein